MAEMRRRRKAALVRADDPAWAAELGVDVGAWVRPDRHAPSDTSYTTTGCAHCRRVHTAAEQNRSIARRWGHVETEVLSLGLLRVTDLAAAAARHLDAQVRAVTVPPPPAPVPPRPRRTR